MRRLAFFLALALPLLGVAVPAEADDPLAGWPKAAADAQRAYEKALNAVPDSRAPTRLARPLLCRGTSRRHRRRSAT